MIDGKRVIAVVPARGGSRSIPLKSIAPLAGRPLIGWSIDLARSMPEIDRVIVSTDSERIARVAREHGAEVYERPARLATDSALVADALRHLAARLRREQEPAELMVLLQATSPLRSAEDVRACLAPLAAGECDSVATFCQAALNPHQAWLLLDGRPQPFLDGARSWQPRQSIPAAYQLTGAVYGFYLDRLPAEGPGLLFGRQRAVVVPRERSLDIDEEIDLIFAEALLREPGSAP